MPDVTDFPASFPTARTPDPMEAPPLRWGVLAPGRNNVNVYAYFASSTAALTDGTNNIPSSAFSIKDGANPAAALTNTYAGFGGANAALLLGTTPITATNRSSNRVDNLTFNIDLSTATLKQLPASSYTGTLTIQAQAL